MLSPAMHHASSGHMGHGMAGGHSMDLMGPMGHHHTGMTNHHGHAQSPAVHPSLMNSGPSPHTPSGLGPPLQVIIKRRGSSRKIIAVFCQ